jgi:hypothetical protein
MGSSKILIILTIVFLKKDWSENMHSLFLTATNADLIEDKYFKGFVVVFVGIRYNSLKKNSVFHFQ